MKIQKLFKYLKKTLKIPSIYIHKGLLGLNKYVRKLILIALSELSKALFHI